MSRQNSRMEDRFAIKAMSGALIGVAICLVIFALGGYDAQIIESRSGFILQILGSALLGVICNGGAIAYEIDSWGVTKATLIHYVASLGAFMLATGLLHWFPTQYLLLVFVIFTVLYAVIWLINFISWRKVIRQMNADLKQMIQNEQGGERQ